ncbi:DUF721 domain-containing protein [Sphingomonas nostoxanthinifaciens]|uniref:DUF721 domain-containing protein n=1 Tax=Sphingomonas nostoxanthinifaciens TaxID=2872652 RepID=UPI001CC1C577|nr:DUF721 domain-containing protein [Sphingomonas nostoxanthinifaciens]UAK26169.1 DciA family protein [Sphingomonas nostoxanthinifaciens]
MGKRMTERKSRAPEPPRGRGPRAIADMLPQVGGAAFRRFGFVQSAVVSRWAEIVGERYADVSAPESIRFPAGKKSGGTLSLAVAAAHGPMMQHVGPAIVERVNRFFGYPAVAKVVIRQGTMSPPAPRRAPPSLRPLPAALGDSLRDVADPELRECLGALANALAASTEIPVMGKVR